jgi:3alpha(or 20beta)-hydroxysteroid dehydrogenase
MSVVITGAGQGQGAAEARRFVDAGARVVAADVSVAAGRDLEAELGRRCRFVELDVTSEEQWSRAVEIPSGWPPLRAVVNNAGIHRTRRIEEETPQELLSLWSVNVLGAFLGMKAVIPILRAVGGGSIINVSSSVGLMGSANHAGYSSSKWGLRGLTRSAAIELGPDGIRVNSIHPGPIDTPMLRRTPLFADPERPPTFDFIPLQRCGGPDEVAELALFLASSQSSYITGAEIAIDGGNTAGIPPRYPAPAPG